MKLLILRTILVTSFLLLGGAESPRASEWDKCDSSVPDSDICNCIAEPTVSCLIDLALAQVHKAQGAGQLDTNIYIYLRKIASIQAMAGDFAAAAVTASKLGARQLLDFVERDLVKYELIEANRSQFRLAAEALIEASGASKVSSRTLEAEAAAVRILAGLGSVDEARSALDDAVYRFAKAVNAGNTEVLPSDSDLVDAAIALGDPAKAREIIGIIYGMEGRGFSPEWRGWTNVYARGALGRALAEAGDFAGAEQIAESLFSKEIRGSVVEAIADARIKSGDVAATIKTIRGLPAGNTSGSRDPTISRLIARLIEDGQPAAAEALAAEKLNPYWRENQWIGIALAYLSAGDIPSAEALLAKITDTGRAAIIIKLAMIRAREKKTGEARRLLGEAREALAVERNPTRLVDFRIQIALVLLQLDDFDGAEATIGIALKSLGEIDNPMTQFYEAVGAAAVQAKLGHQEEALSTLETVTNGGSEDVVYGRILSAKFLADAGFVTDARTILSDALRDMPDGDSIDPLSLAGLYADAAGVLTKVIQRD